LAFAGQVRFVKLPGIGFFDVETTLSLMSGARYGSKDSIRTDVVLRNDAGDIIAIYDVKTGEKGLSRKGLSEGFHLVLSTQTQFDALDGFLPAELVEKQTGFECARRDPQTLISEHPKFEFAARWRYALAFRWDGRDIFQTPAAWIAAAAYAKAADGVLFEDSVHGRPTTSQRAVQFAHNLEKNIQVIRDMPEVEAAVQLVLKEMNAEPLEHAQNKSERLSPANNDYKITVRRIN
jgi:hypothetical protein